MLKQSSDDCLEQSMYLLIINFENIMCSCQAKILSECFLITV